MKRKTDDSTAGITNSSPTKKKDVIKELKKIEIKEYEPIITSKLESPADDLLDGLKLMKLNNLNHTSKSCSHNIYYILV